jgi:hypothetical protein
MPKFYLIPRSLAKFAVAAHMINPVRVGSKNERAVHLRLFVSFLIVRQVVEQGQ